MELIKYYFFAINRPTLLLALLMIFCAITMPISHYIIKKKGLNMTPWRIICFFPLILSIVHFSFYQLQGGLIYTLILYGTAYFSALLIALWQFLYKRKHTYRIMAVLVNISALLSFIMIFSIHSSLFTSVNNFTGKSYTEAFRQTIKTMKKEYVLSEWKEIDYEKLENDIMPMVEKAEKEHDKIGYGIALLTYAYRFNDSHVAFDITNEADEEKICQRIAGNDYGFSMFTLDDGTTIAILTEKGCKADKLGIHDGTVITKWDNVPISKAKQDIECIYPYICSFPVAKNEEYLKSIFLAGKGGSEVQITYIDDDGKENTATIESIGNYSARLEQAISRFYKKEIKGENLSCKMLTANCGYMRINSMSYKILSDSAASIKGEYSEITKVLDKKLEKLRSKGMKRLIIDLRCNGGGSDFMSPSVASLFAKENYFSSRLGKYKDGKYIPMKTSLDVEAYGKYADMPVVVLVNAESMSAADGLAENLSHLPNVTLMGITCSSGVDQTVGGFCFTTNSEYVVLYPVLMTLDEDGLPRIDTKADRITRIPLDEQIELTKESALAVFDNKEDYELNYAVKYMDKIQ